MPAVGAAFVYLIHQFRSLSNSYLTKAHTQHSVGVCQKQQFGLRETRLFPGGSFFPFASLHLMLDFMLFRKTARKQARTYAPSLWCVCVWCRAIVLSETAPKRHHTTSEKENKSPNPTESAWKNCARIVCAVGWGFRKTHHTRHTRGVENLCYT